VAARRGYCTTLICPAAQHHEAEAEQLNEGCNPISVADEVGLGAIGWRKARPCRDPPTGLRVALVVNEAKVVAEGEEEG